MVVLGPCSMRGKKTKAVGIPVIDLSLHDRSKVAELIVEACEEFGFFKVINHGVHKEIVSKLENEGLDFFAKTTTDKQRVGPAKPFGYGCKNIGLNGDMGELEYLLLQTNPSSVSQISESISDTPTKFSCCVNNYTKAVGELNREILELIAEGLWIPDKSVFSKFVKDVHNDSLLRLNYYPPLMNKDRDPSFQYTNTTTNRIGFGEHTDPQILTIFRSNNVGGLQICLRDGLWIPVLPAPDDFYVLCGDTLQALTNGRFQSVKHRVLVNSFKARMSMVYFGAPPLNAWISPLPELVSPHSPTLYKSFTWGEYKNAVYSLRLGDSRLHLFMKNHGTDKLLHDN
ncbi:hypothetical protein ACFE04_018942 [Oxalis oulophora]